MRKKREEIYRFFIEKYGEKTNVRIDKSVYQSELKIQSYFWNHESIGIGIAYRKIHDNFLWMI